MKLINGSLLFSLTALVLPFFSNGFSPILSGSPPSSILSKPTGPISSNFIAAPSTTTNTNIRAGKSALYMAGQRQSAKSKKVITIVREQQQLKKKENVEDQWRVYLHNDEIHTFNYVVRALVKTIGTLDRESAFELCVQTHGSGKAVLTKTWKKQAKQFCVQLQRLGLTASIAPNKNMPGSHGGGNKTQ
mmetsp:Transcript_33342/g.36889  ORF Transcript_33342/g.36889 Transcript_33342/m.36889 type:complete len:189 (+) Transcript_33342:121-687(+)